MNDELAEADSSDGQFARLRPGAGDWRTGWFASHLGELFVRGPDWVFKPPGWLFDNEGRRQRLTFERNNLLPTSRAMRMAVSGDGQRIAFGWTGLTQNLPGVPAHAEAASVWQVNPNQKLWTAPPTVGAPPTLPNPATDFPEMAKDFRLAADALVPGHVATAVALNHDGSRVAVAEYGVWCWVRSKPAIGKWNPPIHALNFLPRQRGRLRVFDGNGKELFREMLPEDALMKSGAGRARGSREAWRAPRGCRSIARLTRSTASSWVQARPGRLHSQMRLQIARCRLPMDALWSRAGMAGFTCWKKPASFQRRWMPEVPHGSLGAMTARSPWRARQTDISCESSEAGSWVGATSFPSRNHRL